MEQAFLRSAYGSRNETALHAVWREHDFCYSVLKTLVSELDAADAVVDLGCGSGDMLTRLSRLNHRVKLIGIDTSDVAVDYARRTLDTRATILQQDLRAPVPVPAKRLVVYSSGFTANLFVENDWFEIVTSWCSSTAPTCVFVYDSFWWDPTEEEIVGKGDVESFTWNAVRHSRRQVARIRIAGDSELTEVISFNHRSRQLFAGTNPELKVREVMNTTLETGQGFSTHACTRVVSKGA